MAASEQSNFLYRTNYGTFEFFNWKESFEQYTNTPLPLDGAIAGDYVVHSSIPGVAVYLGRESSDRVVFQYADGIKKFNTTKVNLDALVRFATEDEIEASGLDADALVNLYSQQVANEAREKRAILAALAEQETEIVKESGEAATGYFSSLNDAFEYLADTNPDHQLELTTDGLGFVN